ncbi:MAG: GTPase Era [Lachnospiraceae bacterium]|nr:GTPase Era [Lachnospiraceae bacterium]
MSTFRSGFVAIIGRTNVGKSTLMNRLIGQKIAITSNKPQTTRTKIRTILTTDEGQAIFIDTPGIHKAKTKLGEYMVTTAERSLAESDLILWLIEPTDYIGTGDRHIAELLGLKSDVPGGNSNASSDKSNNKNPEYNIEKSQKQNQIANEIKDIPKVLVINKIDTITKEKLVELINRYKDLCDFDEIVPISALKGTNEAELKKVIFKLLPEGPMYYDEDELTDQPERQIIAELIREKALRSLSDEIPHGIAVAIEKMKERPYTPRTANGSNTNNSYQDTPFYDIEATIVCERDSHKGIIIGKQGAMLKKIGTASRLEAEALLGCRINLKLFVKVKKDWRDSAFLLKNYGFDVESDE